MSYYIFKKTKQKKLEKVLHTFHDVHNGSNVTLFDDKASLRIVNWVHTVDDFADLGQFQILHEVIAHDGSLYQFSGPIFNKIKIIRILSRIQFLENLIFFYIKRGKKHEDYHFT